MHRFLLTDGRMPFVNLTLVEMIHEGPGVEFTRPDGTKFIGPSVELWFDDDRYLTINATMNQIEALI